MELYVDVDNPPSRTVLMKAVNIITGHRVGFHSIYYEVESAGAKYQVRLRDITDHSALGLCDCQATTVCSHLVAALVQHHRKV